MKKKIDDRGAALVLVVIIISFISIIIATLFLATTLNIQMKSIDKKSKENFYSAEGVLEQLSAGLQNAISESSEKSYLLAMQSYTMDNTDPTSTDSDELFRRKRFATAFVSEMSSRVSDDGAYASYGKLYAFVDQKIKDNGTVNITTTDDAIKAETGYDPKASDAKVAKIEVVEPDKTQKGIYTLRGINIEYIDNEGNRSSITTDICMEVPNPNFISTNTIPDIFSFSLIANRMINIDGTGHELGGNVYAGFASNGTPKTDATGAYNTGIYVKPSSNVKFNGGTGSKIIIADDLVLDNGASVVVDAGEEIWADNIKLVNGSTFESNTATYVQNDLSLNGSNSKAIIKGAYYGFGNGDVLYADNVFTELDGSGGNSAILINGKSSSLDLRDIRTLMIAGTAQIGTKKEAFWDVYTGRPIGNYNINTGESIEVKSNQLSYLVPAECVGVEITAEGNHVTKVGKNPLTYGEYEKLLEANYQLVDINKKIEGMPAAGNTLSKYMTAGYDGYLPVYQQDVNLGTLIYLYVNLDQVQLNKYSQNYYASHKEKADEYMDPYVNQIIVNDLSTITTVGNMIRNQGKTNTGLTAQQMELTSASALVDGSGNKTFAGNRLDNTTSVDGKRFQALSHKLINDYTSIEKKAPVTKSIFQNIINSTTDPTTGVVSFSGLENKQNYNRVTGLNGVYNFTAKDDAGNVEAQAYVVIGNDFTYTTGSPDNLRMIICDHDVYIQKDFTGIIICNGSVYVQGANIKIKNNDVAVEGINKLLMVDTYGTNPAGVDPIKITKADASGNQVEITLAEAIFVDGASYVQTASGGSIVNKDAAFVEYSQLITYENWSKN